MLSTDIPNRNVSSRFAIGGHYGDGSLPFQRQFEEQRENSKSTLTNQERDCPDWSEKHEVVSHLNVLIQMQTLEADVLTERIIIMIYI